MVTKIVERRELLKIASTTLIALTTGKVNFGMPGELVQTVGQRADWKPVFFNAQQNEMLVVLTEVIIPRTDTPGANDAKVHRYLDLFLSVSNAGDQKKFMSGLAWLDNYSRQTCRKDFAKCSPTEQIAVVSRMADSKQAGETGNSFFWQVKNMTAMIYFSTPEGYKELNKFGPPPGTVGCEHPAGHVHLQK